jgi:hypothetical protein
MGFLQILLPWSMMWSLSPPWRQETFIQSQQLVLKGQWNSKCSIVSSGGWVHIRQLYPERRVNFLLFNIFLVLSLSHKTSYMKNLMRGVHFDFHSHWKASWTWISLK